MDDFIVLSDMASVELTDEAIDALSELAEECIWAAERPSWREFLQMSEASRAAWVSAAMRVEQAKALMREPAPAQEDPEIRKILSDGCDLIQKNLSQETTEAK
jgi:hypothetical protein